MDLLVVKPSEAADELWGCEGQDPWLEAASEATEELAAHQQYYFRRRRMS